MKWWTPEEVEQSFKRFDMVSSRWFGGSFIQSPYRKMDIVIRCANRYMRRYGLKRNVEVWNFVCKLICSRMQAHMSTCKAVLHHPYTARNLTPLAKEYASEFDLPHPTRLLGEIQTRLDRIKEMKRRRREEIERRCCICFKNDADVSRYFWQEDQKLLGLHELLKDRNSKCCLPCHLKFSKLLVKAKEADALRLSVQRFKRKQNEATKNNARTA